MLEHLARGENRGNEAACPFLSCAHLRILILLLMMLISACAFNRTLPSLSLVDMHVGEMTLFETNLLVKIRYQNEDNKPLDLNGSKHEIYLNNIYIGKGISSERLVVPALGSATQDLTIALSNVSLATRVRSLIESERFDYEIRSTLYPESGPGFGLGDIEVVNRGDFLGRKY